MSGILRTRSVLAWTTFVMSVCSGSSAWADPPAPTAEQAFETQSDPHADDESRFRLQAGGSFASGNTQAVSANASGVFLVRRGENQGEIDAAANYGVGWVVPMGAASTAPRMQVMTAENYLARARFDRFFLQDNSLYVVAQGYRDVPSGFNARLSWQAGYLRNIVNEPTRRRLWFEIGYDLTYENLVMSTPPPPATERVLHSARGFVGFEDHTTPMLDVILGLEAIVPIYQQSSAMNGTALDLWRLNGQAQIGSKISDSLQIALSFVFHYLNTPVPGHLPLDTLTIVTLVYQMVSHPISPMPPPPPETSAAPTQTAASAPTPHPASSETAALAQPGT